LKCLGQWLATGLPLALAAPITAVALGAPPTLAPLILLSAVVGGLAFAFAGGIGAALSLGARRGGLLTAVIVLPLFTPPVIFGGGALDAFAGGLDRRAGFALPVRLCRSRRRPGFRSPWRGPVATPCPEE